MMVNEKSVLLLLSGGKDSFLASCRLVEDGYNLYLVTYDNGCGFQPQNAKSVADRLIKRYGEERVEFLGIKSVAGIWRRFFPLILNVKPTDIAKQYGEMTYSQFNCLSCRTSMYIYSIALCRKLDIKLIAEGARKDQGFVIELDNMIGQYKDILKSYDIELLLPVHDLNDNWELKNELLDSHFVPKTLEPQCLLGFPLEKTQLDEDVIDGTVNFFVTTMKDKIRGLVEYLDRKIFDDNGEMNE